ncbi:MAG: helix-turn-helix domain-containing protein [Oscillospiraceae bacterium]
MQLNEAVAKRISELCKERNMTQYQLYLRSGVPQSTLSTIMSCAYPSMKLRILYEICEGLDIGLQEFFSSPLFARENLDD